MFEHQKYIAQFLVSPVNDAEHMGVTIERAQSQPGEIYYRCIGVHHLTPQENQGKHSTFLDAINDRGERLWGTQIEWEWEGMRRDETPRPAIIDKPMGETGADIAMHKGQKITVKVKGFRSDRVKNLHTGHADDPHHPGNTWGHHSFYVVFLRTVTGVTPVPKPVPTPVPTPQPAPDLFQPHEKSVLREALNILLKKLQ